MAFFKILPFFKIRPFFIILTFTKIWPFFEKKCCLSYFHLVVGDGLEAFDALVLDTAPAGHVPDVALVEDRQALVEPLGHEIVDQLSGLLVRAIRSDSMHE